MEIQMKFRKTFRENEDWRKSIYTTYQLVHDEEMVVLTAKVKKWNRTTEDLPRMWCPIEGGWGFIYTEWVILKPPLGAKYVTNVEASDEG